MKFIMQFDGVVDATQPFDNIPMKKFVAFKNLIERVASDQIRAAGRSKAETVEVIRKGSGGDADVGIDLSR